jgi:hypothetical protein
MNCLTVCVSVCDVLFGATPAFWLLLLVAVCCFFLLHEVPDDYKRAIVRTLLRSVIKTNEDNKPNAAVGNESSSSSGKGKGKVVFVDYHMPANSHPLKFVMHTVRFSSCIFL